jgi:hypothetical protein
MQSGSREHESEENTNEVPSKGVRNPFSALAKIARLRGRQPASQFYSTPSWVLINEGRDQRMRQLSVGSLTESVKREGWATLFVLARTKNGMRTERYTPAGPGSVLLTNCRVFWYRRLSGGGSLKDWWRLKEGVRETPTGYLEIELCDIERLSVADQGPAQRVRLNMAPAFYELAFQADQQSAPASELSVSWFKTIKQLLDELL